MFLHIMPLLPIQYAAFVLVFSAVLYRLQLSPVILFALTAGIFLSYMHASKAEVPAPLVHELIEILKKYEATSDVERSVSNFLRLANQIETEKLPNQAYDNLLEMKNKVQNDFHSLIYSNAEDDNGHVRDMKRVTELLNEELNAALSLVNAYNLKNGTNTRTKFHYRNHPGGNDNEFDQHWSFFQR